MQVLPRSWFCSRWSIWHGAGNLRDIFISLDVKEEVIALSEMLPSLYNITEIRIQQQWGYYSYELCLSSVGNSVCKKISYRTQEDSEKLGKLKFQAVVNVKSRF